MQARRYCAVLVLTFMVSAGMMRAWSKTIEVGASKEVKSISEAVQAAGAGDTVLVNQGIYREGNILIRKPIVLLGHGYPVLDGGNEHELLTVNSGDVVIQGFRLIRTGTASMRDIAAIKVVDAVRLKVLNNRFEDTFFGIHISNSSHSLIEGNTMRGTGLQRAEQDVGNGIHLWKCHHITVRRNQVEQHRDGIYFEFVTQSIVEENISRENMRYGLHFMFSHEDHYINNIFERNGSGVAVMYTKGVTMQGNTFGSNQGAAAYALLLKDISDSRIYNCRFVNNTVAIYVEGSSRCVFQANDFRQNGWALKIQASCDNNTLTRNNFLGNTFDVATNGSLSLNTLTANYWDKYEGYDLDRDGTGDIPFSPVSLYGMIVERMPTAMLLWRSFLVFLIDRAEKVVPAVTPENLRDNEPAMRAYDRN